MRSGGARCHHGRRKSGSKEKTRQIPIYAMTFMWGPIGTSSAPAIEGLARRPGRGGWHRCTFVFQTGRHFRFDMDRSRPSTVSPFMQMPLPYAIGDQDGRDRFDAIEPVLDCRTAGLCHYVGIEICIPWFAWRTCRVNRLMWRVAGSGTPAGHQAMRTPKAPLIPSPTFVWVQYLAFNRLLMLPVNVIV